ncbi:MAG: hypothetical protein HW421_1517 [Ignavibacteria bacterium]|nr:hypothetical protein [Ignavibacteria bacterium]
MDRPKIEIILSESDRLVETLARVSLIILWGLTIYYYRLLPDTIPIHFNAAGNPDDYGTKLTIFLLPLIGTILFIGLTILNKYPHKFNYPVEITPDNLLKQYTVATKLIRFLKLIIIIIFILINILSCMTALGKTSGLGWWFLPLSLIMVFGTVIFYFFSAFKSK